MLTGHAVAARINAFRIRTETIRIPVHLRSKRRERLCLETLRKKLEKLVIKQTFPQQTPFKKKSLIPNRFSSLFPSSFNMKRIFFLSRYCIDTRAVTSHSRIPCIDACKDHIQYYIMHLLLLFPFSVSIPRIWRID